jgi:sugar O-acyltransferase (sialic acid O-acetyltransferase NeuD family)
MGKKLAIIGSGDLGVQIAHFALLGHHYTKVVFFDDFNFHGHKNGLEIIGGTADIEQAYKNKQFDELIMGFGYKHMEVRKKMFDNFQSLNIPFGTIIHSTAWVDPTATIKSGCVIYPSCSIDAHSIVDHNTVLNIACTIAHDTTVGRHCFLSPRVAIAGFVNVQEQSILGINSTVIDNITIAPRTQIGAGTIVIRNILESGVYVGNPARRIKENDTI